MNDTVNIIKLIDYYIAENYLESYDIGTLLKLKLSLNTEYDYYLNIDNLDLNEMKYKELTDSILNFFNKIKNNIKENYEMYNYNWNIKINVYIN
jgi:hypothetical protein